MYALICLFFLVLIPSTLNAAEWWSYASSKTAEFYYDASSVKYSQKQMYKVWTKDIEKDDSSSKTLYELDCKGHKLRTLQITYYNKDGNVNFSSDSASKWGELIPETIGESLHKAICIDASFLKKHRIWKYLSSDDSGYYSYDVNNIEHHSKNSVLIWIKFFKKLRQQSMKENDKGNDQTDIFDRLNEDTLREVSLLKVNCSKRKLSTLRSIEFNKDYIGYINIDYTTLDPKGLELPLSQGDSILKYICVSEKSKKGKSAKK